jgi:dTMP kinase
MFITFEGIDYSGKTTQAELLVNRLRAAGTEVLFLREPGGTLVSEKIREILLDRRHLEMTDRAEIFLFSAARAQLVEQVICPALRAGRTVVCDRFDDSTTAYQGYGRGLNLADVTTINRFATAGTRPDLTILVDVDVDEVVRRRVVAGMSADRMESLGRQFFETVRHAYMAIARAEPERFIILNGMRPIEEIHQEIWIAVQRNRTKGGG